jgi:hypothetical protein
MMPASRLGNIKLIIIVYNITGQKRVKTNLSQPKLDGLKQVKV